MPRAEDLSDCAYYQGGTGTCSYGGCRTEPDCITKRPVGGWPSEVPTPQQPLYDALGRQVGYFMDGGTLDLAAVLAGPVTPGFEMVED